METFCAGSGDGRDVEAFLPSSGYVAVSPAPTFSGY
jgi:hypothetical protein